jgi:hypothetical protein
VTAAKIKPLILSVSGFALSSVGNILIIVILNGFCLLPAFLLCNHKRTVLESHMQIADRCAPWKITTDAERPILQALQFQFMGFCRKFPGGTGISH